ncbi:aconitase family protein [Pseudomonas sp. PCH446]
MTDYYKAAGLTRYLDELGFALVGYGCTTCIGNSGPLPEPIEKAITQSDLTVASVLSGNRNFEGGCIRWSRPTGWPRRRWWWPMPWPAACASISVANRWVKTRTASRCTCGISGRARRKSPRRWPRSIPPCSTRSMPKSSPATPSGRQLQCPGRHLCLAEGFDLYPAPTVLRRYRRPPPLIEDIQGARILALLGDSVTTDHISPAGNIKADSPAGRYLRELGVEPRDFNSYGSRRGNHEVMMRGTFANIRIRNEMLGGEEGGNTFHVPSGEKLPIYDAAMRYQAEGTPLVVIAGQEYGTGSSRDWAAKGTNLLGSRR